MLITVSTLLYTTNIENQWDSVVFYDTPINKVYNTDYIVSVTPINGSIETVKIAWNPPNMNLLRPAQLSNFLAVSKSLITLNSGLVAVSDIEPSVLLIALGTGVVWGGITGLLSNQTDLQNELDDLFAIAVAL